MPAVTDGVGEPSLGEKAGIEPAFGDEGCDASLSTGGLSPIVSIIRDLVGD